jgi:hypothetical protein
LTGVDGNPVIAPPVLYLHSYRAVRPGAVQLRDLSGPPRLVPDPMVGNFKRTASIMVLAAAGGVEGVDQTMADASTSLEQLSSLVGQFTGGGLRPKLQLLGEEQLWLMVTLPDGSVAPFDVLSSGQKEIISTLFLIWQATRDCPSVVLIDEPELHLHQEWHDDFMRALFELAPHNQYIIATHSRRIAECVYPDRLRTILP